MFRFVSASIVAVAAIAMVASPAAAEKKPVKPTNSWMGSIDDEKLQTEAKDVITDAKGLETLWKAWKIADKMPEIDFKKELVVVQTTRGSKLNVSGRLDTDSGNLEVLGLATRDLRPGFRYVIATFEREGVKTVNGKELGK